MSHDNNALNDAAGSDTSQITTRNHRSRTPWKRIWMTFLNLIIVISMIMPNISAASPATEVNTALQLQSQNIPPAFQNPIKPRPVIKRPEAQISVRPENKFLVSNAIDKTQFTTSSLDNPAKSDNSPLPLMFVENVG